MKEGGRKRVCMHAWIVNWIYIEEAVVELNYGPWTKVER